MFEKTYLQQKVHKDLSSTFSRNEFLIATLPSVMQSVGASRGGLVRQREGRWNNEAWVGSPSPIPDELVSNAIDQGASRCAEGWCVAPLIPSRQKDSDIDQANSVSALVFELPETLKAKPLNQITTDRIKAATELFSAALERLDTHQRDSRRIQQLSFLLKASVQWQRLDDDEELLERLAAAATELLSCERASIFLWDRRRKKLIGRPALGVEGNRLEVDDHVGVVGEVLASGEPRIWSDSSDDEKRINRNVDQALNFQTHSLVAVPMIGPREETIGVFEAINHKDGSFDQLDVAALADLSLHASVAIESQRARRSLTESRDRLVDDAASATQLIGQHQSMEIVRRDATKVAGTDLNVLVLGKNGTGKEVLARHIHYESKRRNGPFIAVNCAALVETLLESELFGHEKGAFTDANQTRIGKFELASGGTLFLDEVGDMSAGGQAKLLRVLEDRVVVRVGGSQTIPVDVRVVAATNQPLEEMIAEKRFREDLFFRLNVVSLTLPPLHQRGDDVFILAEHFLSQFSYQIGRPVPALDESAKQALLSHPWPGNIRELRNTMERVCYLCGEENIFADDLMLGGTSLGGKTSSAASNFFASLPASLTEATHEFQVAHIDRAIEACGGNMTEAAERLGLHRSNLYRKMRQLGMQTSGE